MSTENWRTPVTAGDFFGNQKKRIELEQRRPTIRRASDLVGPGIGASAVRITNYDDTLATYNGFYSAEPGAISAPDANRPAGVPPEPFTGFTVMDDELGGTQVFTGLVSGNEYRRVFLRNPGDPSSITFGVWKSGAVPVPASVVGIGGGVPTVLAPNRNDFLTPPQISVIGEADTYMRESPMVYIRKPGVYTGFLRITPANVISLSVGITWPQAGGTMTTTLQTPSVHGGLWVPVSFWSTAPDTPLYIMANHAVTGNQTVTWSHLSLIRVGPSS